MKRINVFYLALVTFWIFPACQNNQQQTITCTIPNSNIYFERAGINYESTGDFRKVSTNYLKLGSVTSCPFYNHIDTAMGLIIPYPAPFGNTPYTYQLFQGIYFNANALDTSYTDTAFGELTFNEITADSFATGTFQYTMRFDSPVIHLYDPATGTWVYTDTTKVTGSFNHVKIIN